MENLESTLSLTDVLSQTLEGQVDVVTQSDDFDLAVSNVNYQDDEQYAYMLGQIAFFFPPDALSEVIENVEYAHLPRMPETVLGLCNVRGNLVPVFDLHKFLEISLEGKARHLLCIGSGQDMVGILLDDMPIRVKRSECKALRSAPILPASVQPYISQVYIKGNQVILDYQHEALFQSLCH